MITKLRKDGIGDDFLFWNDFALLELCSDVSVCVTQKSSIPKFFLLVPFRKLPGRNVYAQMHNEKEQEMTSPVNHSEDTQNIIQGEEFIDDDLDSQTLGNARGNFVFSLWLFIRSWFLIDVCFHFSSFSFSVQSQKDVTNGNTTNKGLPQSPFGLLEIQPNVWMMCYIEHEYRDSSLMSGDWLEQF